MLSVYLGCLIFGGALVAASALGGSDHDGGGHGGAGDGHGAAGDHHVSGPDGHPTDKGHPATGLVALLNLRFWSFALAFFGLTGLALSLVGAGVIVTPLIAGGVGAGAGYGSARLLGALAKRSVGAIEGVGAHIGREGKLLLPVQKGQRGKVRFLVGGISNDLPAETEGDAALPIGSAVLVVGFRGNVALVEGTPSAPALPASTEDKESS
jgi:hypothetical protein